VEGALKEGRVGGKNAPSYKEGGTKDEKDQKKIRKTYSFSGKSPEISPGGLKDGWLKNCRKWSRQLQRDQRNKLRERNARALPGKRKLWAPNRREN